MCRLLPPTWTLYCFFMKTIKTVCVGSFPFWILQYFWMKTIRNACAWAPFLLLGFSTLSLWKPIRNTCVCAGSFPPPWILHNFFMKTIRNVCVCVGSLPPPWILHYFLSKTIRNVCVCMCVCVRVGSFPANY